MYGAVLLFHSYLRWLVLALLVASLARAVKYSIAGTPFSAKERKLHLATMIAADTQLLLGLLLLATSPIISMAASSMPAAMKNPILRFWLVEHPSMMILSLIAVHLGKMLSAKAPPELGPRKARVWFAVALLLMLAAIPWPFLRHGRPLL
ncbi:MAG: hypothetical protein KBF88_11550 [Polyangiaceae bacterium]|nr:hypothetical protein [Polyangiaceae bacterium]